MHSVVASVWTDVWYCRKPSLKCWFNSTEETLWLQTSVSEKVTGTGELHHRLSDRQCDLWSVSYWAFQSPRVQWERGLCFHGDVTGGVWRAGRGPGVTRLQLTFTEVHGQRRECQTSVLTRNAVKNQTKTSLRSLKESFNSVSVQKEINTIIFNYIKNILFNCVQYLLLYI